MSKVSHRVAKIIPLSHEDKEEALQGSEIPDTLDEEKFSITRFKFKDIMVKVLEDQKNLADATSAEAIKAAFTKGVKHRSEMETQPLHSSLWKLRLFIRTLLLLMMNTGLMLSIS